MPSLVVIGKQIKVKRSGGHNVPPPPPPSLYNNNIPSLNRVNGRFTRSIFGSNYASGIVSAHRNADLHH